MEPFIGDFVVGFPTILGLLICIVVGLQIAGVVAYNKEMKKKVIFLFGERS